MVYVYNGILLSLKEEWNYAICLSMDGTWDYHAKWNKPVPKKQRRMFSLICECLHTIRGGKRRIEVHWIRQRGMEGREEELE